MCKEVSDLSPRVSHNVTLLSFIMQCTGTLFICYVLVIIYNLKLIVMSIKQKFFLKSFFTLGKACYIEMTTYCRNNNVKN